MASLLLFILLVMGLIYLCNKSIALILPVSVCAMLPLLMILGIFQKLLWLPYVLLTFSVILCVLIAKKQRTSPYSIKTSLKNTANNFFNPSLIILIISGVFFYYFTQNMHIHGWDMTVQWGFEPKMIWGFDGFAHGTDYTVTRYSDYTQGVALFTWWISYIFGNMTEQLMFFSLFFFYAILILPLFSKITWKKSWITPFAVLLCLALPQAINQLSFDVLSIDTLQALCFGCCLTSIYQLQKKNTFALISFIVYATAMVLIKEIGLLYVAICLILYFVLKCHKTQLKRNTLLCFFVPIIFYIAWLVFCNITGRTPSLKGGLFNNIFSMLNGSYQFPAHISVIAPKLWQSISSIAPTTILFQLPKVVWVLLISLILSLFAYLDKSNRKTLIILSISNIIFMALLVAIQYFAFIAIFGGEATTYFEDTQKHVNNLFGLMQRYLAPINIGFIFFTLWFAFNINISQNNKAIKIIGYSLCILLFLATNWTKLYSLYLGSVPQEEWSISIAEELTPIDATLLPTDTQANILMGYVLDREYQQYAYAPHRFTYLTEEISNGQLLKQLILDNNITHVICYDDRTLRNNKFTLYYLLTEMCPDEAPPELYTLYEIVIEDDGYIWLNYL